MKKNFSTFALPLLAFLFVFTSCKKDDPEEVHEEEEINRVVLSVFQTGASQQDTYTWNEGETIPSIALSANATYQVSVSFYDASDASDIENITEEVIEEADEHYVFFETAGANLTIASASTDTTDSDNIPINLNTQWTTAAASSGSVRVYLIHEPTTKSGSSRDDFGGETDVEVNFPVTIQ